MNFPGDEWIVMDSLLAAFVLFCWRKKKQPGKTLLLSHKPCKCTHCGIVGIKKTYTMSHVRGGERNIKITLLSVHNNFFCEEVPCLKK